MECVFQGIDTRSWRTPHLISRKSGRATITRSLRDFQTYPPHPPPPTHRKSFRSLQQAFEHICEICGRHQHQILERLEARNLSKAIDPTLPTFHFIFLEDVDLIFKIFKNISCFLEDVDPIFKICKTIQNRFHDSGMRLFWFFNKSDFQICEISKDNNFQNGVGIFLNHLECLGVSKDKNNWFRGPWTHP